MLWRKKFKSSEEYNEWYRKYRERNRDKVREYSKKYQRKWRLNQGKDAVNVFKQKTRDKTHYALKNGLISKKHCEKCGDGKSEMHHPNYRDPLLVIWLCRKCHILIKKTKKIKLG